MPKMAARTDHIQPQQAQPGKLTSQRRATLGSRWWLAVAWGGHLLLLHLLMVLLVSLALYFPGLDLLLSCLYLILLTALAWNLGKDSRLSLPATAVAGLIAQLPGFLLTIASRDSYLGLAAGPTYWPFVLQLWHTPFLPLLSLFPFPVAGGLSLAYRALFFLSGAYVIFMLTVASLSRKQKERPLAS